MKKQVMTVAALLALCAAVAGMGASANEQDALWNQYCNADGTVRRASADLPKPNYANEVVRAAAEKLNYIRKANDRAEGAENTFYFYSDIMDVYGVKGTKPEYAPEWVSADANAYLTIACGEYRDNVAMMERKIKWARDIVVVPQGKQTYDASRGVWQQFTGQGYSRLVELSGMLYELRASELNVNPSDTLEQKAVPGMTECEYRYMLKEYIAGDKELDTIPEAIDPEDSWYSAEDREENRKERESAIAKYEQYKTGLAAFVAGGECSEDEKNHYNEFRGDGNFKAQSMESNAFIWNTRVFAKGCASPAKAKKKKGNILTDADCEAYFRAPWNGREELTKQGALRLFFYPESLNQLMRNTSSALVFITEDLNGDGVADMVVFDKSGEGARKILQLRQEAKYAQDSQNWNQMSKLREELYKHVLNAVSKKVQLGEKYAPAIAMLEGAGEMPTDGVQVVTDLHSAWKSEMMGRPDRGFAEVFADPAKAWDRLSTVLDRHTDWYQIDMVNLQTGVYQPTFSPWVASSYYISASDAFTCPGYAMGGCSDPYKHWMYVQRVKKDAWFTTDSMRAEWPRTLDLMNTWFDETTFSRTHLGESERAWDRFGSATPEEIAAALWLVESGAGAEW